MSAFLMVIGALLVGVTGWLGLRAVMLPRLQIEDHLRDVDSYGFHGGSDSAEAGTDLRSEGWLRAVLAGPAERIGGFLMRRLRFLPALTRQDLSAAGHYDASPETVHGYRAMETVLVSGLITLLVLAGGLSALKVVILLAIVALSWELPATVIRARGRKRLDEIDRTLPQFVDLVVATVEAGISFGGAVNGAASRFTGALGEELQLTMHQQNLGISSERALQDMLQRCDTPAVRSFVRAVVRAESHGVSIGPMLRHLAHDIRQRRRDIARERIQKAPVKLLFPLVLLILPALLIVIMFPAMYNIVHVISGT